MPEEIYTVRYIADASAFIAGARQVEAAIKAVDAIATQGKKSLSGFAGGAGRSATNAAKKIQDLNGALASVPGHAAAAKTALGGIGIAAKGSTANINEMIKAGLAISVARDAFQSMLQVTQQIEERWHKLAQESAEFRDSLRELANIRGENGPNNKVMADTLSLGLAINAVPEEARKFAQSYENVGPTVRAKGHYKPDAGQGTKEELEKSVTTEAGRTAGRMGLDLEAAGEAIGTAGLFHTFTSKEQAMDIFGGAMSGLSQGKLSYTPGVKALNKASAKLVDPAEARGENATPGRIQSYDDAGIYMGTMSLGTGTADQAAHRMVQNSRLLNPSSDTGKAALAQAGVTDQMDDAQRLIHMGKFFKTNKIADVRGWLKKNDIGSDATREGAEASFKVSDVLEQRLAENHKVRAGKKTIEENDKYLATDRNASATRAKVVDATVGQVQGEQVEPYERAKAFAEKRRELHDPNKNSRFHQAVTATVGNILGWAAYGEKGENVLNFMNASDQLGSEAKKHGVDLGDKKYAGLGSTDYQERAKAFKAASDDVKAKGGDPFGEKQIEVDTQNRVNQMRPAAAGQAGAPGANAAGGPAIPGKVASLDSSGLNKVTGKFDSVLDKLDRVVARMDRGGASPGSHLGGPYNPYLS